MRNEDGQFFYSGISIFPGNQDTSKYTKLEIELTKKKILNLDIFYSNSMWLTRDGEVYSVNLNGIDKIEFPFLCKSVSVGSGFICVLGENGKVYEINLQEIPFPEAVVELVCCYQHFMAISESGKLYLVSQNEISYG